MYHTAELTYTPTRTLFNKFINNPHTKYIPDDAVFLNTYYSNKGVTFFGYEQNNVDFHRPLIKAKLNFAEMTGAEVRLGVSDADYGKISDAFNEVMLDLFEASTQTNLMNWRVHRIDYAVDIHTPYVSKYIKLLKKSNVRHHKKSYKEEHHIEEYEDSFYRVSRAERTKNRSTTINFYDKYKQAQTKENVTAEEIEQVKDILRLEVECHKIKTETIKRKYEFNAKQPYEYIDAAVSYDVIKHTLTNITRDADFQRRSVALDMIEQSSYKQSNKRLMKKLIEDVAVQNSSIEKVRQAWEQKNICSKAKFSELLRKLELINVNPVTISDNEKLEGKTYKEGLESLHKLFEDAYWS